MLPAANAALHLVIGPGKVLAIVALHQLRPQVGEYPYELAEALPLPLGKGPLGQLLR